MKVPEAVQGVVAATGPLIVSAVFEIAESQPIPSQGTATVLLAEAIVKTLTVLPLSVKV